MSGSAIKKPQLEEPQEINTLRPSTNKLHEEDNERKEAFGVPKMPGVYFSLPMFWFYEDPDEDTLATSKFL